MQQKNIYLVAFYFAKPKPHVNTCVSGWMKNPDNIRYDEKVEITNGIRNNASSAKIILDLTNKRVVRNGWNSDVEFNELFKYFFKGYHEYVTKVMTQLDPEYFNSMLDEMQAEWQADTGSQDKQTTE